VAVARGCEAILSGAAFDASGVRALAHRSNYSEAARHLDAAVPSRRRDDSSLTTLLVEPNQRAGLYRLALRLKALPPEMAADNRVFSLSQLTMFCGDGAALFVVLRSNLPRGVHIK